MRENDNFVNNAISIKNVEKSFRVYFDKGNMLKERFVSRNRSRYEERQILNGISIDIPKGQAVGLIGRNGCGKSTTLKLLSKIMRPNNGNVIVNGRVSSLIELGAGFHPDMSGRENIYINASIFGLSKAEIDKNLDKIIEFSEMGDFIDNPVRTYSSGMYMRLAFAVAINVNADILLIDEILAVGDVSFQKKCFDKLMEIKAQGTTIVIVSHSMDQLYQICDRLIWLEKGKVVEDGIPKEVGTHYMDSMEIERMAQIQECSVEKFKDAVNSSLLDVVTYVLPDAQRDGSGEVRIIKVEPLDKDGKECFVFDTGDKVTFRITYKAETEGIRGSFYLDMKKHGWEYAYGCRLHDEDAEFPLLKNKGTVEFTINSLNLLSGPYFISIGIYKNNKGEMFDNLYNFMAISIRDHKTNEFGNHSMDYKWKIE